MNEFDSSPESVASKYTTSAMSSSSSSSSSSAAASNAAGTPSPSPSQYNSNNKPPQTPDGANGSGKKKKSKREFDWTKAETEHCLLKIAYIGTNYYGIAYLNDESVDKYDPKPASAEVGDSDESPAASSASPASPVGNGKTKTQQQESLPTVETFLFQALLKTKLIKSRAECNFARCGRTDRGVHAAGNYISLDLRKTDKRREMLNGCLPRDIRICEIQVVKDKFNARFDCLSRMYKYFFVRNGMDVGAMREAAKHLIGKHDFRNFCKMDLDQTTNFVRTIVGVEWSVTDGGVHLVTIRGTAFLWHQIRCIMSILFMVGRGDEDSSITKELLDIEKHPRKPLYGLADEGGLVLYDCQFEGLKFSAASEKDFGGMYQESLRQTAILRSFGGREYNAPSYDTVCKRDKKSSSGKYTSLLQRGTGPTLEEKLETWNRNKAAKAAANGTTADKKRDCSALVNDRDEERLSKLAKIDDASSGAAGSAK